LKSFKGRNHLEEKCEDERIILKWILKKYSGKIALDSSGSG
jgi:hypothetical protein